MDTRAPLTEDAADTGAVRAQLDAAFDDGRLIFLAGSGISLASGLPSADALLRRTLELVLPSAPPSHWNPLAGLQPELVYEAIIRITGDRHCLRLWGVLSTEMQRRHGFSALPNDIHRLLVAYSHRFAIPLVTPNFDVMFERAADELGIPYTVYLPEDKPPSSFERLAICKIHGSVETTEGNFDTASIWTTASEIATYNAPWIEFLTRHARRRHWCFVGYSGRDIDLFPHLAGAGGETLPIIWIDRFSPDAPATGNAARAKAIRVEGWPSEVFAKLGKFVPTSPGKPRDFAALLDALAADFSHEVKIDPGQRKLLQATLVGQAETPQAALDVLGEISADEFRAMPIPSQVEYCRLQAFCFHELSRYVQLGRSGLRMARYGLKDASALIHGLIVHAESLRMRIPADSYFPEQGAAVRLAQIVAVGHFVAVALLVGGYLGLSGRSLRSLQPTVRHAVIEHGVRFLAIVQRLAGKRAKSPDALIGRLLRRTWTFIHASSHDHGYAAGMANAWKFLYRIAPELGHGDAPRIYGMFSHRTGAELLRRNEADAAFERGDHMTALAGYRDYLDMALRNGNVLNAVKAMLGQFRVREAMGCPPLDDPAELGQFVELAGQVEGQLLQRHFRKIGNWLDIHGSTRQTPPPIAGRQREPHDPVVGIRETKT